MQNKRKFRTKKFIYINYKHMDSRDVIIIKNPVNSIYANCELIEIYFANFFNSLILFIR